MGVKSGQGQQIVIAGQRREEREAKYLYQVIIRSSPLFSSKTDTARPNHRLLKFKQEQTPCSQLPTLWFAFDASWRPILPALRPTYSALLRTLTYREQGQQDPEQPRPPNSVVRSCNLLHALQNKHHLKHTSRYLLGNSVPSSWFFLTQNLLPSTRPGPLRRGPPGIFLLSANRRCPPLYPI